jgi:transketolase
MYRVIIWDPVQPDADCSGRLVLSEGLADPIIYAACADLGVMITLGGHSRAMTMDDHMALRSIGSPIDGHPSPILVSRFSTPRAAPWDDSSNVCVGPLH